ncbi:MAG: hypothetical protein KJ737_05440 [Proteobacteria bacterium]|nr:hypothetical protein [Pseudomonadota bacterium]
MKLWSRGLGKTELNMDFKYYKVAANSSSQNVYIVGKITDPVDWEFKITMGPADIAGLTKIFFNWSVIKLVVKHLYTYPLYLVNRRQYEDKIENNIETKVNDAYNSMMQGRKRRTLTRTQDDLFNQPV